MSYAFRNPIDIGNRALQHLGQPRISLSAGFGEDSKAADEISACYDKLRQAELRRNTWKCAIKKAILRPLDTDTAIVSPTLWSSATVYRPGALVSDEQNRLWIGLTSSNTNNSPGNSFAWEPYFGPLTADLWDEDIEYSQGELVYKTPGDGTYVVYMALVSGTTEDPATGTAYDETVTYHKNDVVTVSATPYVSLVDFNLDNEPSASPTKWSTTLVGTGAGSVEWRQLSAGLVPVRSFYPQGAGPLTQDTTRNLYRLPANFLAKAPQDPKQGSVSLLGAPTNPGYRDWDLEGDYIVSSETGPILFRFVADVTEVTKFDPMFCEGLACRIATETCEALTQSGNKLQTIASAYRLFMSEARQKNAIEIGAEEDPLDDFIACRA
jgi:hypothetical protein